MFLAIRDLEQKPLRFQQSLSPGAISFDDGFVQITPLEAAGVAEWLESTSEIHVTGSLAVSFQIECDRCLDPIPVEVRENFDLIYRSESDIPDKAEIALKASESNIGYYAGNGLELNDIFSEQVILALPLQRLCRPDCRGICPACGQNRNTDPCQCAEKPVDERWSALRDFPTKPKQNS
jgi:uncharacterized protein